MDENVHVLRPAIEPFPNTKLPRLLPEPWILHAASVAD
jgi:hypothetical protein